MNLQQRQREQKKNLWNWHLCKSCLVLFSRSHSPAAIINVLSRPCCSVGLMIHLCQVKVDLKSSQIEMFESWEVASESARKGAKIQFGRWIMLNGRKKMQTKPHSVAMTNYMVQNSLRMNTSHCKTHLAFQWKKKFFFGSEKGKKTKGFFLSKSFSISTCKTISLSVDVHWRWILSGKN